MLNPEKQREMSEQARLEHEERVKKEEAEEAKKKCGIDPSLCDGALVDIVAPAIQTSGLGHCPALLSQ